MKAPVRALALLALVGCAPVDAGDDETPLHDDQEIGDSLPPDGKSDYVGLTVPPTVILDKRKVVYLTFDDGPSRVNTPKILDVLQKHGVRATFFITGTSIAGNRDIIERQRDEGHVVASHQWSHVIATASTFRTYVRRERDALREIVGDQHSLLFRFPYGAGVPWKQTILREEGYLDGGIGWDIDSLDWDFGNDGRSARATPAFRSDYEGWVMDQLNRRGGGVVLMHDIQSITAGHLDSIIGKMKAAGYRFGELPRQRNWIGDECVDDDDCHYGGSVCLAGLCAMPCSSSCPDAWGRPTTRCARVADEDGSGQVQVCTADCAASSCRAGECVSSTSPAGSARRVCWAM
jgi:peptidoglycan/xylan/chitin deacetylase (PgdA/CDA1 family)